MNRRAFLVNAGLGAALAGGGTAAYFMVWGNKPAAATGQQRTVAVAQGTVMATVTADGSVQSSTSMKADFVTSGRVTEVNAKVGDVVAAGAVLAKVDATEQNADLATAKKNLTAAKSALSRATTDEAKESMQNQVDQAKASVEAAQRKVDGTVLKAPMAGTVVAVNGSVGGSSVASAGFMVLADLAKMEVSASVPEADATRLKAGQTATVTWNALTNVTANGHVSSISPTPSSSSGSGGGGGTSNVVSYPIVVALDTLPEGVRLGQSVSLRVTVDQVENALYVPNAAVRSVGGRRVVTVGTETRAVQIGLVGDTFTVITSGLSAGEQVVLATATTGGTTTQFPGGAVPGGGGFTGGGGGFTGGGPR